MIVWQGFWFLAALIPIILIGLIGAVDKGHSMTYGFELALIISAIAVWFVGKKLNGKQGKVLIDPETNEKVELKNKHTLFWIPMEWFSIVIAAFAIFGITMHFS